MGRRLCPLALVAIVVASSTAGAGSAKSLDAPGQLPPVGTSLPSIGGTPIQGQQLTADAGAWDGPSASYAYQWGRCTTSGASCSIISGATGQSYKLTADDVGSTLRAIVTASNKNGSAVATSQPTPAITSPPPASPSASASGEITPGATTTAATTSSGTTTTTTPVAPTTTIAPTTTTTPTTTALTPTGTVVFSGNFETGNYSQWTWNAQCANTGVASDSNYARGNFYAVRDIVAQGLYAGRFDLPAASTRSACEVLRKRTLNLGADEYYALDVRFPTNWVEPDVGVGNGGWGMTLAQFNFQNIWGAPIELVAHADNVRVILQSGSCVFGSGCAYTSGNGGNVPIAFAVPPGQLTLGVWHEFIVHVRWAALSGIVEIWHRLKGEGGWTKTATYSGYPTVQSAPGSSPDPNQTTADKEGAYRGPSTTPLSIWHDGFCVATSFGAADNCL